MVPKEAGFISFPPTYTGGYEKLYSALMEVFAWDEPDYELFYKDRLAVMVGAMKEKRFWMMARDEPIPGLEGYEVGKIVPTEAPSQVLKRLSMDTYKQ